MTDDVLFETLGRPMQAISTERTRAMTDVDAPRPDAPTCECGHRDVAHAGACMAIVRNIGEPRRCDCPQYEPAARDD